MEVIHRATLQTSDFDGLAIVAVHNAGAFAEDLDGADSGATGTEEIGIENG